MHFDLTVSVDLEREEGKFASREELLGQIIEAIEEANPEQLDGEGGGIYSVTDWTVEEYVQPTQEVRRPRKPRGDDQTLVGSSADLKLEAQSGELHATGDAALGGEGA